MTTNLGMRRGPIHNILVEHIEANNAYSFVRLLSNTSTIDDITVRGVTGSCRYYAVNINEWDFGAGAGAIRNVVLDDFNVRKTSGVNTPLIDIALDVHNLRISNFVRNDSDSVATLTLRNGLNNRVQLDNGNEQRIQTFSIAKGNIKELRVNPPLPPL